MKTKTLLLLAGSILQSFSPFAVQIFAQNNAGQNLTDSHAFFQTAVRRPRTERDIFS